MEATTTTMPAEPRDDGRRGAEGHPARAVLRPRLRLRLHPGHRADGGQPDLGGPRPGDARPGGGLVGVGRLRLADQLAALRRRHRPRRAAGRDGGDADRGARRPAGVRRRLGRLRDRLLRRPRDPHRRLRLRRARRQQPRGDPQPRPGPARGAGADRARRLPRRRRGGRALGRRPADRLRHAVRARRQRLHRLALALPRALRPDRDHRPRRVDRRHRLRARRHRAHRAASSPRPSPGW